MTYNVCQLVKVGLFGKLIAFSILMLSFFAQQ